MRVAYRALPGRHAQDARRDPAVRAQLRHGRARIDGSAGRQVPREARGQQRMANLRRRRIVLGAGQQPLRHRGARHARLRLQLPVSANAGTPAAMHGARRGRRAKMTSPAEAGLVASGRRKAVRLAVTDRR
ncbi:hypothetical protein BVI1335_260017 [Burkholderia vietnamiensis]|nr:hypothetical protein BVI1335_260017 [Burkholderia vietnamiensis]